MPRIRAKTMDATTPVRIAAQTGHPNVRVAMAKPYAPRAMKPA
jgi:hypothetical protein